MHGVAERIEYGGGVAVHVRIVPPDVGHRQSDVFGEAAGPVDADAGSVGAEVTISRHAIAAAPANHVTFAGNQFAGVEIDNVGADLNDLADKFVADRHGHGDGLLSPRIPVVNVNVGTAYTGAMDSNQNVVDADGRLGNVFQPQTGTGLRFDQCFHGISR